MSIFKLKKEDKVQVIKYALFFWIAALLLRIGVYFGGSTKDIGFHSFADFSRFMLASFGFGFLMWDIVKFMKNK